MIKTLLKRSFVFITLIGLIMIAVNFISGETISTFITKETILQTSNQTLAWYKIDIYKYLEHLRNNLNDNFYSNIPNIPTWPTFSDIDGWTLGITAVIKVFMYLINWVIYLADILFLLPLKFIFYSIKIILSILGINLNGLKQASSAIYHLNIEYLDYSWISFE